MEKNKSCIDCGRQSCEKMEAGYPDFCPAEGVSPETLERVQARYEEEQNRRISVISAHSKALVTTLVAKDRVLAHNPVGALYQTKGYYSRLLEDK